MTDAPPYRRIPADLAKAVRKLTFENPSDKRLALQALAAPEPPTPSTISWLVSLVSRKGARYDYTNPNHHSGPYKWPLPETCCA